MGARQDPKLTTCHEPEAFEAIGEGWFDTLGVYPPRAAALVVLAQFCEETARGQKMYNWNIGGVKCPNGPTSAYDWTEYTTTEGYGESKRTIRPPNPGCRFRAYNSLREACAAQIALFQKTFPTMLAKAAEGDAAGFAAEGHKHEYFTGDPVAYGRALTSMVHEFASLPLASWEIAAQSAATVPDVAAVEPLPAAPQDEVGKTA